jgi:hypothetical protein
VIDIYWCCHAYFDSTWNTRWFKYDRDDLCVNKSQFVPVIFEPPWTSAHSVLTELQFNSFKINHGLNWGHSSLCISKEFVDQLFQNIFIAYMFKIWTHGLGILNSVFAGSSHQGGVILTPWRLKLLYKIIIAASVSVRRTQRNPIMGTKHPMLLG